MHDVIVALREVLGGVGLRLSCEARPFFSSTTCSMTAGQKSQTPRVEHPCSRGGFRGLEYREFVYVLNCGSQQLGGTPGLRDAAARRVRRIGVGNL